MSTHTPGPWRAIESRSKDGWMIASVEGGELCDPVVWQMGGIDHEPNAHLIAAAPDLLAACEQILAECDRKRKDFYLTISTEGQELARAAIAKARNA